MNEVEDAETSSFEHLDLVVEALHEAAGMPVQEVVGDFVQMAIQSGQETVETSQLAVSDSLLPGFDFASGLGFGQILFKDVRQLLAKGMCLFQVWRICKDAIQQLLFFLGQFRRF